MERGRDRGNYRGGNNRGGNNRGGNNRGGNNRGGNNRRGNNRGGSNLGFANCGNRNGSNERNRNGERGRRGRFGENNQPNNEIHMNNDNNNGHSGFNQIQGASNNALNGNMNYYRPPKPKNLRINETRSLLVKMLSDTYNNNIPMELNDPVNGFINFLNCTRHHLYDDPLKQFETTKLIIQVLIKAENEAQSKQTFASVLKSVLDTDFCLKLIDKLINIELFATDETDWELVILLLKFFKLMLQILPSYSHDKIGARISNILIVLDRPTLVIEEYYITELLQESEDLKVLQNEITHLSKENITKDKKSTSQRFNYDEIDPPNNFRELAIFPSSQDLLEIRTRDVFIRKNKERGYYKNVDDYLDIQFRLMHEDFVQPLREGLVQYLSDNVMNKDVKHKQFNIRVYHKVLLNNALPVERNGIVHTLSFDISKLKRINWTQTKRLIFASLLILSDDNFQTLLFATVADRKITDLEKGLVTVKFIDCKPKKNVSYTMIESMNMFEAYRHILKRLQSITAETFCMKSYFVEGQNEIKKPIYMQHNLHRVYEIKSGHVQVGVDGAIWPRATELGLNDSQFKAFKNGLTKELSVIQGPPGTGKTYLGLKICQCLLKNIVEKVPNFGPILIVCYTNHALDQFVEGICEFTKRIVRVGSRSKSEKLEPFSLKNVKQSYNSITYRRRCGKIYSDIKELKESIMNYQVLMKSSHTRLISLTRLSKYLSPAQFQFLNHVELKTWLYGNDQRINIPNYYAEEISNILEEIMYDEYSTQLYKIAIETYEEAADPEFHDNDDDNEVNYLNNMRRLDVDDDDIDTMTKELEGLMRRVNFENNIDYLDDQNQVDQDGFKMVRSKTSINLFKTRLKSTNFMSKADVDRIGDNLHNLEISKRWQLYRYWRQLFIEDLAKESEKIEREFELKSIELQEVSYDEDRHIMSEQHIIGMTTTGAARYGDVLEALQCKIIIVEEAAEVLESHIIGSLNRGCQHLILIGDHKQLRPNPSVYRLSKDFNLDLSLFERLINNNIEYATLELQHRMRPEISKLMSHIYDNLYDHPSVKEYPNVPGVAHNLFFINHTESESANSDIMSYHNSYEAQFVVKLCRHLMKNDIAKNKITILTLYTGQMFEIKKLMNKEKNLYKEVRVCVVDNYQGEENDIIILSLVRSNNDGKVGFLKIENRICVCLSRAKHGLFIFGNAEMFTNQNTDSLWTKVILDLRNRNQLGNALQLSCQNHPAKRSMMISKPSDFDLYPEGGCDVLCNARLNCGHACKKVCHILDKNHENHKCFEKCTKKCDKCGTNCKDKCHQKCSPCNTKVPKVIPNCGHQQQISCSVSPKPSHCTNKCERELISCGHKCVKLCRDNCQPCQTNIMKECQDCKTIKDYPCSMKLSNLKCRVECQKVFLCGHVCKGSCDSCFNGRLHLACKEKCNSLLVCGHVCNGSCNENCPPCEKKCEYECMHNNCFKKCGDKCINCLEKCKWKCPHKQCTKLCSEICDRDVCNEKCGTKGLICKLCKKKFPCYGICGEFCRKVCKRCDKTGMTEIFFGTEDDEDARFITLWTCGHSFEVTSMDKYMQKSQDSSQIVTKTCPRCKSIINQKSCYRYGNIIKHLQVDVQSVQDAILREFNITNTNEFLLKYELKCYDLKSLFDKFNADFYFEALHEKYQNDKRSVSGFIDKKYTISLNLVLTIESNLLRRYQRLAPDSLGITYIRRCITKMISWLHPENRNFKQEELDQFYEELGRIELLLYLNDCCKYAKTSDSNYPNMRAELNEYLNEIKFTMTNNKEQRQMMKQLIIKCYKRHGYLSSLAVTDEERQKIVAAVGLGKGRWFRCPFGHYYVIGECGGATQVSRCPECNEQIGGENHALLANNRFAPEIDGATNTAWPTMMREREINFEDISDIDD